MELFGIILSIPVVFIFSILYSAILNKILIKWNFLSEYVVWVSLIVISLFMIELILLTFFGASKLQHLSKNIYYTIHLVLFFLSLPSFINILKIKMDYLDKWYYIGILAVIFAVFIIFIQISVSEILFRIE